MKVKYGGSTERMLWGEGSEGERRLGRKGRTPSSMPWEATERFGVTLRVDGSGGKHRGGAGTPVKLWSFH